MSQKIKLGGSRLKYSKWYENTTDGSQSTSRVYARPLHPHRHGYPVIGTSIEEHQGRVGCDTKEAKQRLTASLLLPIHMSVTRSTFSKNVDTPKWSLSCFTLTCILARSGTCRGVSLHKLELGHRRVSNSDRTSDRHLASTPSVLWHSHIR